MAGTISSLGIGSGVLTSDVIEQLREADEARVITPLDNKITVSQQKEEAFKLLDSLMTAFKGSVSALNNDSLYLNRSVSGGTDAVTVTAEAGVDVQSFTIENIARAQGEIYQSERFSATDEAVAPGDASSPATGTLTLTIDGKNYEIDYSKTTTLESLVETINEEAGSVVTASILQVGESDYELILKSDAVGADQAITFGDSLNDGTNDAFSMLTALGLENANNHIQTARDASFDYNGIQITRGTNEIDDLLTGVTISLEQDQEAGDVANIAIVQNEESIRNEMSMFVENYNNLITNLHDMTTSDLETGTAGVFNGESFIKSISRQLNSIITSINADGRSLIDYGIDLDKNSYMSFDTAVFNAKMEEDPSALELLFSGGTVNGNEQDGIFTLLNEQMNTYTGYNGLLDNFETKLGTDQDRLVSERTRLLETLTARYAIMEKRFTAYDAIISKINAQFSALQQMIDAELAANNN